MESIIQAIRYGGRRARLVVGDALERSGLTHMPPVPTILGVVIVALAVPLAFGVPARPPALADDIATLRVEHYLETVPQTPLHAGPAGDIYSQRPCFHWPPHPDAVRYSFRLMRDDGATVILTDLLEEPRYLRRAPASLEIGRTYRFEVKALDAHGNSIAWVGEDGRKRYIEQGASPLRVVEPPPALAEIIEKARLELQPADTAWVLAGYFASIDAPADVAAALETYLDAAPGGPRAGLALRLLERLGCR